MIDLPEVRVEGDEDPSHVMYVYLWDRGEEDPREFTDDDYLFEPQYGECWSAAVDGYPSTSGAEFIFCPAGAAAGEASIDDPLHVDFFLGDPNLQDYTGQDRLYMTQEQTPYPHVRATGS